MVRTYHETQTDPNLVQRRGQPARGRGKPREDPLVDTTSHSPVVRLPIVQSDVDQSLPSEMLPEEMTEGMGQFSRPSTMASLATPIPPWDTISLE